MSLLSVADAFTAITTRVPRLPATRLPLSQLAGCGLAEPVIMERDQPPFDRVAMDGIAVHDRSTATRRRIAGVQAAGTAPLSLEHPDDCIEVMTGAELPRGTNCVIAVEAIKVIDGHAHLSGDVTMQAGQHIHARGSDARAGEVVLTTGTRLTAIDIAVMASAGCAHALACAPPRIALVSTGNELVEPGLPIEPWQIRRSNIHAVRAALTTHGFAQLQDAHIDDDLDALRTRLRRLLDDNEVLVLSGGVSMGKFDFVPQVLGELGVQCVLHKVAQKPGKPLWFGVHPDGKAVFALPGNPVSTLMCLHRYVLPGLLAMMGCTQAPQHVAVQGSWRSHPELTLFVPATLVSDATHGLCAVLKPTRGSGDFMSLLDSHGFVEIAPNTTPQDAAALRYVGW